MAKRPPGSTDEIYLAMINETDRGCVLVSAAWLEDRMSTAIEFLLKTVGLYGVYPVPSDELESLMKSLIDGAMGRAGSKVAFCRAMGMIKKETATALDALFNLRNVHFAHFAGVSRLTDPRVADQLHNFIEAAGAPEDYAEHKFPGEAKSARLRHSKKRREFMNAILQVSVDIFGGSIPMTKLIQKSHPYHPQSPNK